MGKAVREMLEHDRRLTDILNSEIRHEIPGIQTISKETQFWREGKLVAEPDGLIWDGNTLYILEYKCSEKGLRKAQRQVETAHDYIKNDLGIFVPCEYLIKYG
ncbi:hypothetical protein HOA59_01410 [archaeon]|jgi:hypothetical protein|nr:hypothetical protein [archaeon]MBT6824073.1 hypothetical protein [archaeon]MBT7107082.1 hypothetical protein [archaeon]MBT7297694.1 hypothetical protein [archaeon]